MTLSKIAIAALALLGGTTLAHGADVYTHTGNGSLKDAPVAYVAPSRGRGGFYISGTLGYAWIDRDYSRTIDREVGFDFAIPKDATQEQIDELADKLTEEGIAHRGNLVPGGNLVLPLVGDILKFSDTDDAGSFVYGAGVQYLWHKGGKFGFSLGVDVEAYGNGKSTFKHEDLAGKISSGNLIGDFGCGGTGCAGEDSPFPQSGFATAERNYDIDLVALAHYFLNDRLAIHGGGGVSFGNADVCGVNKSGATHPDLVKMFDTSYCDSDTAIGPMAKVGFQYWATDAVTIGVDATAKWHSFEASGDAYHAVGGDRLKIYGQSHDETEVDDFAFAVKGRISVNVSGQDSPLN